MRLAVKPEHFPTTFPFLSAASVIDNRTQPVAPDERERESDQQQVVGLTDQAEDATNNNIRKTRSNTNIVVISD